VGNLSVGGTGKSPMIEYLVKLLHKELKLATLSRGYKRETKGFKLVETSSTVKEVGDEPLQFKSKFPNILVAVDADRRNGIKRLRSLHPQPEIVLLDDAYQHRKVRAGFYVLLTAYYDLYSDDILLPTGNLREPKKGASRADMIVVTKCPKNISFEEREKICKKLVIDDGQSLFFSTIDYSDTVVSGTVLKPINWFKSESFALVTGIANPAPLVAHYSSLDLKFEHINFPDHHNFSIKEINTLKKYKCIITTEKDYMRLSQYFDLETLWYQPIEVKFIEGEDSFKKGIYNYIKNEI